ncbi:MAG: GlsB/YeaQ/YmgE family stress response membrane protein [Dermatophilaceae bacterium]
MIGTLIGAVVAGLIIGALGRLLVPGKQNISILVTIVIGIVASLAANLILGAIFGYTGGGGISWWYWIVGAILAAIGIVVYGRMTSGRTNA